MSMLPRSRTFRLDCFASISKTEVSSETSVEVGIPPKMLQFGRDPTNTPIPLDFIRRTEEPRLLLIVPEHACRCGYSLCRGFIVPKYASEAKVDGDEALHRAYLYYFLRSDAKTGFGRCGL